MTFMVMLAQSGFAPLILIGAFICFVIAGFVDWRTDGVWPKVRVGWLGLAILMGFLASQITSFNAFYPWLIIFALLCFIAAAFTEAVFAQFRLGWVGLALYTASMMVQMGAKP